MRSNAHSARAERCGIAEHGGSRQSRRRAAAATPARRGRAGGHGSDSAVGVRSLARDRAARRARRNGPAGVRALHRRGAPPGAQGRAHAAPPAPAETLRTAPRIGATRDDVLPRAGAVGPSRGGRSRDRRDSRASAPVVQSPAERVLRVATRIPPLSPRNGIQRGGTPRPGGARHPAAAHHRRGGPRGPARHGR